MRDTGPIFGVSHFTTVFDQSHQITIAIVFPIFMAIAAPCAFMKMSVSTPEVTLMSGMEAEQWFSVSSCQF